jgi:type I restriction enzyme S subunit
MYCLWAAAKRSVFAVEGNQSTIVHLTGEQLRVHRFPWPPRGEQADIVARLDWAKERVRRVTKTIEAQVSRLAERRQAIITAAVTGQWKLHGLAS